MPSRSRSQQRFFGMVHACQKYGKCASPEIEKVSGEISLKDAEDFASTKHKGLPEKKEGYTEFSVYKCPKCGGDALNGIPEKGIRFRGSAQCQECGESFSAIGLSKIGTHKINEGLMSFKEWLSKTKSSEITFG